MSGCTFCRSIGSCCNAHSRGAGSWLFRKLGRADICADNLPPPPVGVRVQQSIIGGYFVNGLGFADAVVKS